jgi:hypothetical protein
LVDWCTYRLIRTEWERSCQERVNLLHELADRLTELKTANSNRHLLYDYLKFYRTYPQIVSTVSAQLQEHVPEYITDRVEKVPTQLHVPPEQLLSNLSYSKIKLLVDVDDEAQRVFYVIECMRGNCSVRELNRQIGSLYYERSGLSKNKRKLSAMVQTGAEQTPAALSIRNPYIFEFLGTNQRK